MLCEIYKGVYCDPQEVSNVQLKANHTGSVDTEVELTSGRNIIIVGDVIDAVVTNINEALKPKVGFSPHPEVFKHLYPDSSIPEYSGMQHRSTWHRGKNTSP